MSVRRGCFAAALLMALQGAGAAWAQTPADTAGVLKLLDGAWALGPGEAVGPFPGVELPCEEPVRLEAPNPAEGWVELRIPYIAGQRLDLKLEGAVIGFVGENFVLAPAGPDTFEIRPSASAPQTGGRTITRCR